MARRALLVMTSLLASSLAYVWCGVAPTLAHIYIARFCGGLAGGTMPVVQAMVLDTVGDPRQRAKYFGLCGASLTLAFAVGPGFTAVVGALLGKRAALCTPAILATLCIVLGVFKLRETRVGGGLCGPRSAAVARASR